MSDVSILEETDRTTGRDALRKNIQAAVALAGAVRSTLGPKGLDKLLVDDEGRSMVTNDGITVLESAKVEHPIAHMLIAASATQDQTVRDGTTTTVLLAKTNGCKTPGILLLKAYILQRLHVVIEWLKYTAKIILIPWPLKLRQRTFCQQQ